MFLPCNVVSMVVVPPLLIVTTATLTDTLQGSDECHSHGECVGANLICGYDGDTLPGRCVCRQGYTWDRYGRDCVRTVPGMESGHVTCSTDADCDRNEVCMSWQYDPALEFARKLGNRLSSGLEQPEKHQFCVDAWIIYNNHLSELDEPRTGGGLRSHRRGFDSEDYYFSARRPARQYNAYGEDMMLVLFLVCILATLVTVHRAACYRQIQDARRNTPLRHILPIPEDNPPPYTHRYPDNVDGPSSIVHSSPKPLTEAPPPTYEEALERQAIAQNSIVETHVEQNHTNSTDLSMEDREETDENVEVVNTEINDALPVQSTVEQELINPYRLDTVEGVLPKTEDVTLKLDEEGQEEQDVEIGGNEVRIDETLLNQDVGTNPANNSASESDNTCEDIVCTVNIENETNIDKEETVKLIESKNCQSDDSGKD